MFTKYKDRIGSVVQNRKSNNSFQKGIGSFDNNQYSKLINSLITSQSEFQKLSHIDESLILSTLSNNLAAKELGHPDFKHIKSTNQNEYHNIVSVFIDIDGSTNLHKEYNLEEIYVITNTIQCAAIHICTRLGGHIQRLQGDGIFCYFGGKNIDKTDAAQKAILAVSLLTYFISMDVKKALSNEEIDPIKIKTGIDFGEDAKTLWANFGVHNINEVTTLSLHTSLANKMQKYAKPNGIVVGENIKTLVKLEDSLFDYPRDSNGDIKKRYIYEDVKKNYRYTQYSFNWYTYLSSLTFIKKLSNGELQIVNTNELQRVQKLDDTIKLIKSGNAHLSNAGVVTSNIIDVKHNPHRFHYAE